MTRYQSGIRTVSKGLWLTCPVDDCGQQTYRSRRFTGVDANALADVWAPEPRCFPHLRAARRAEVGA